MKTSEVLAVIKSLKEIDDSLKSKLTDDESLVVNIGVLNSFIDNLRTLVSHKNNDLESSNDVISSKSSAGVMTKEDWIYFFESTPIRPEERELLVGKLHTITNFTFPILELFPAAGKFTEAATAGEPLYIVDYSQELLDLAAQKFNDFYATRRLMQYVVADFDLSMLPKEQFGLAFSYNLFFIKNIDFIVNWAKEVLQVLKPGGYFVFNFIPANTSWGMTLAENFRLTAIDTERLEKMLTDLGYTVVSTELAPNYASTMVVKKQGELTTFKLSSSFAKIIEKNSPFV
jgi:ubiquinone/menaquinone biosynthesis C-methylase UbiE